MKKQNHFLILVAVLLCNFIVAQNSLRKTTIQIIPKPTEVIFAEGSFAISAKTKVYLTDTISKRSVQEFLDTFKTVSNMQLQIVSKRPKKNYIAFIVSNNVSEEGYELKATPKNITITAQTSRGFMYAIGTLRQLLPMAIEKQSKQTGVKWEIPAVSIKDEPRYQQRGLMLDLCRHFFNKEYILKTIDRLAMHKMNVLRLHMVDDQGWRMEVKKYPKLTEIGAWRVNQEDKAWNSRAKNDPNDKGTYGGYLSQSDLKEIVQYAHFKNVEIIPEIEMPAHVSSAIAAYPHLSCFNKPIGVPSGGVWPITDIFCAGKESTFEFLEDVIDEVITIFPSQYIHIGGDEAAKDNWKICPHCQKRIQEEGLKDVNELQSYFVKRIEKYINSKGKKMIGWDEIIDGGLPPEATVMSWRGTKGGIEAAEQQHDVIMTPESHCYFNFYQGPQNEEPVAFNAFLPLHTVYEFDPIADAMTPEVSKHILGGHANLWAEHIDSESLSEYMLFPRLAAMSEVLWSTKESRNWVDFTTRLEKMLQRYDILGINYAKSAYLITPTSRVDLTTKKVMIGLQNEFPSPDIRYVLGNQPLDSKAIPYQEPIQIDKTTIIQASLFKDNKPIGKIFKDTIVFHKAVGSNIEFQTPFNENYKGDGNLSLVNIIRGTKNFHDGQWQAWLRDDMEAVIDLGSKREINSVTLGSLESQGSGIYFPTEISVYGSLDGKKYEPLGTIERAFTPNVNVDLNDFKIQWKPTSTRYIKVIAKNLRKNPEGGDTWLFVDEIIVN
ncbi:glycoside hydrolase family 20 protein [Flavobacterium agrisoli]|uniref:beta-N-acetylhexosaminidase n=1 Tax=Flavobacterium agrisoli TaxID=2793066 RepID=A0A934UIE2_9FLAO|nr:family 20 glycosylhydrolase [Flavobacterium agrisoli]MBK0368295.1 family 20 glycosylhydrolase [Flavobacterium agrisoli]